MSEDSKADTYTASFKTHGGYDASMIVVRGDDALEFGSNIVALTADPEVPGGVSVVQAVVDTELLIHAAATASGLGSQPAPAAAPAASAAPAAAAAPAAGGDVKTCAHGVRTRREGVNARGPWVGHYCPLRKGDPNQCAAVFE